MHKFKSVRQAQRFVTAPAASSDCSCAFHGSDLATPFCAQSNPRQDSWRQVMGESIQWV
jgi:hypothetical protein